MICAQCDRCGRRSILSPRESASPAQADDAPAVEGPGAHTRVRCDLCGSRNVRVVRLASMFEAVAFVNGRLSAR